MFELVYFWVNLLFLLLIGLGSIWYIYHISALCLVTLTIFGINFFLSRGTAKIRPLKLFPVLLTYIWAASVICMILSNSGYWQDCYSPRISPLYCTHIEYGAFFFTHLAALATALYLIVFSKLKRRIQLLLLFILFLPVSFEIIQIQWQQKSPVGELILSYLRIQLFALAAWGVMHYFRQLSAKVFRNLQKAARNNKQKRIISGVFRMMPRGLLAAVIAALMIPLVSHIKSFKNYSLYQHLPVNIINYNNTAVAVKYMLFLSTPLHLEEELTMMIARLYTFFNTRVRSTSGCNSSSPAVLWIPEPLYSQFGYEYTSFVHLTYSRKKILNEFEGLEAAVTRRCFLAGRTWNSRAEQRHSEYYPGDYSVIAIFNEHFIALPHFYKLVKDNDVYHIAVVICKNPDEDCDDMLFPVYLNVWKNRKPYIVRKLYEAKNPCHDDVVSTMTQDGIIHLELKPVKKLKKINIFDREKTSVRSGRNQTSKEAKNEK